MPAQAPLMSALITTSYIGNIHCYTIYCFVDAYTSDGLDCREYCMQGLTEAEACGDVEMQAEFLFQGALLDLQEGRSLEDIKHTLKVITGSKIGTLGKETHTSRPDHSYMNT